MRLSLRTEIALTFTLVTLLSVLMNTVVVWGLAGLLLEKEQERSGSALALAAAAVIGSQATARDAIGVASNLPEVAGVGIYDVQGNLLASHGRVPTKVFSPGEIDALPPVGSTAPGLTASDRRTFTVVARSALGAAVITVKRPAESAQATQFRMVTFYSVVLTAVLVAFFGAGLLERTVVRPVRALVSATVQVAAGRYDAKVPASGAGELTELGQAFNHMTTALADHNVQIERQLAEVKHANDQLSLAQEELVQTEKLASIGRLAAGVAHELGNPLGAITGYVSMLVLDERDSNRKEVLQRIASETKRMDRIIRDLLDYARPKKSNAGPFAIADVVETAVSIVSAQRGFRDIEVIQRFAEGLPLVAADPHRIQQVFVNLLINASDAMGGRGRITIEVEGGEFPEHTAPIRRASDMAPPLGPAVEIRVTDTGPGIDPDVTGKIFDPFYTTKEPGHGTGLGLAICRRIVNECGGRIAVERKRGPGAVFVIQLPPAG